MTSSCKSLFYCLLGSSFLIFSRYVVMLWKFQTAIYHWPVAVDSQCRLLVTMLVAIIGRCSIHAWWWLRYSLLNSPSSQSSLSYHLGMCAVVCSDYYSWLLIWLPGFKSWLGANMLWGSISTQGIPEPSSIWGSTSIPGQLNIKL